MRTFRTCSLAVLICLSGAAACSGSPDAASEAAPAPPPPAAATTTSPTPVQPSKSDDVASAKRAVMTTTALGTPWVQPKKVNTTGQANEACPGKPALETLAPARASAVATFTRGKARGASIARFTVATVTDQGVAHRSAWARTVKSCATFKDASGLYVVTSTEGPKTLAGTDDVVSRAERIYYDSDHKKLAYARHFISARIDRTISTVEYDFLTTTSDPKAKDFTTTQKLLTLQLTRTKAEFAS
ncbi:MAG: hypothetical protein ABWX96_02180 [Propionibacteriaceae bacterium]